MGGFGSGRKSEVKCTENYWSIDINQWQRKDNLEPGNSFLGECTRSDKKSTFINVSTETGQLWLAYSYRYNDGVWDDLDYSVRLQTTPCHYGGLRYWFICPSIGCSRRVGILYKRGRYFACRCCQQLVYKSQREIKGDRADRKVNKIKEKLKWPGGILNFPGGKPKGMHWKTYYRLLADHTNYLGQALVGLSIKRKKINDSLSKIEKQMALSISKYNL